MNPLILNNSEWDMKRLIISLEMFTVPENQFLSIK